MQKTGPLARVQREVTGRRLLWNVFFYGSHIALFSYGWVRLPFVAKIRTQADRSGSRLPTHASRY
jgi:hypothetical protein